MTKLKAGVIRTPHNEGMSFDGSSGSVSVEEGETEFYLKPEADEVIAELQKQVHDYAQGLYVTQAKAEKEMRRQKYKRCLGNAWLCKKLSAAYAWFASTHRGWKANPACDSKADRWRKWARRWMELANKFKEDK